MAAGRRRPCPPLSSRPRWPEAGQPRPAGTIGQIRPPSSALGRWSTSPHRHRRAGPARAGELSGRRRSPTPSRRRPTAGLGRSRMDGTNWSRRGVGLGRNRMAGTKRSRPAGGSRAGLPGKQRGSSGSPPGAGSVRTRSRTRTRPMRARVASRAFRVQPGRPSRSGPTSRSGPSRVIAPASGRSISPAPSRHTSQRTLPRPESRSSRPGRRRCPTSTDSRSPRPRCCRSGSRLNRMCRWCRS